MRVTLLPSTWGTRRGIHCLSGYRVNDSVVIDAGSVGFDANTDRQKAVKHVFLTHAHIDHIASLPILLDNVYPLAPSGVHVYGLASTLDCLRRDVFNDRLWPDFVRISATLPVPFLTLHELTPGVSVCVEGLTITPVAVDHVMPTVSFLLQDNTAAVAIVTDTLPTQEVWGHFRSLSGYRGVFLECSFPDSLENIARLSKHLTPSLFQAEITKIPPEARIIATHLKPSFFQHIKNALKQLGDPRVRVGKPGRTYVFGPKTP